MKNSNVIKDEYFVNYSTCTSIFDCDHGWMPSCDMCPYSESAALIPLKSVQEIQENAEKINEFVIESINNNQKSNVFLNEDGNFFLEYSNNNDIYCHISELKLGIDENVYIIS